MPEFSPEEISRLVSDHAGDLMRCARGMGLSHADAEEVVSASFAAFLEASRRFEGRSSIKTFLFGILYNKALEHGRHGARELATDPSDQIFEKRFDRGGHWSRPPQGPAEQADISELAELIDSCLEALPAQQRAVFHLKEVDRQSSANIRNILGIADTHLRVLFFRARNRLRECLEAKWK